MADINWYLKVNTKLPRGTFKGVHREHSLKREVLLLFGWSPVLQVYALSMLTILNFSMQIMKKNITDILQ